ncbi:MAG TPA: class I adenylate-forming enzyme family protein [Polyangiaceae bacterium]
MLQALNPLADGSVRLLDGDENRLASDTLADAVNRIIRCDGRSPSAEVGACLPLEARALLEVLGVVPVHAGSAPSSTREPLCHLAVYDDGRPYLSLARPAGGDLTTMAWANVRPEQIERIGNARARLAQLARAADAESNGMLEALSPTAYTELIRHVIDSVDHNDPIQVHVDDALFCNVGRFNNLLAKPGGAPGGRCTLNRIEYGALDGTSIAERRFLGAMLLLRLADLRAEEFNGRQLTPLALSTYFGHKYRQYSRLLASAGADDTIESWPAGLADRAACLGRLKQRTQRTHQVYRWIDGLTFRKEERWRRREREPTTRDLPPAIRQHCLERFAVSADDMGHHDVFFLEVMRRIARIEAQPARSAAFEELLEVVVRAAMHEVSSPIGMTRGVRDLRHFQDAIEEGRFADVCASPLEDGFCAVFARDDVSLYTDPPLAKVVTAMARRMQFNHRHYLPGLFDRAAVPCRPHFYHPPTMSDIAENGDHRHPGHAMARVRYSIRAPAPLRIAGRSWPGLVDIRMMRAVGHPYTEADLIAVDRHTEYIRSIAQAALALKSEGLRAPVVAGFERSDYERRYPQPPPREIAAATSPAARPAVGQILREGPAVGQILREGMERRGGHGAIVCATSGRTFTLADVEAVALRLAEVTGAHPGRRVSVVCGDRVHQAVLIAAGLAAGQIVCPLDHAARPRALDTLLRHSAPDVVLTDASAKPLPGSTHASVLYAEALISGTRPRGSLPIASAGGLLIYTSGATGIPKGVLLDEHQIGANVAFARDHFGYRSTPPWTSGCLLPLHHTFAIVSDLLPVLSVGGRVVVLSAFDSSDAGAVAAAFGRHSVRSFSAVPSVLEALVALDVPLPACLSFAITGTAPLLERNRLRYQERYGHPVVPCYGLTESVCFATASPVGGGRPGSVGRAAGITIRIVGGDLQPLGVGEEGEIALQGSSVITGCFEASPGQLDPRFEDGWFLTGDMGHLDEQGFLYITGRRKNMLIRGGEKLYLDDLDRCLEEHAAVAEACSIQVPGLFGFERAVAFVVAKHPTGGGADADEEGIRAHVRDRLGALGIPDELRWTDRIPRSATGKPLWDALRSRCAGAA